MTKEELREFRSKHFPAETITESRLSMNAKFKIKARRIRSWEEGVIGIPKWFEFMIELYLK